MGTKISDDEEARGAKRIFASARSASSCKIFVFFSQQRPLSYRNVGNELTFRLERHDADRILGAVVGKEHRRVNRAFVLVKRVDGLRLPRYVSMVEALVLLI